MNCRYTCIDSFCGAGGLALGLRRAGLEVLVSFDASKCAVETFRRNLSGRCLHAKAEDLTGARLFKEAGFDGRLDLFAGGPPCQGFSKQKRGAHLGDERNELVLEFARLVRETDPRFFLLENVDQLGKKRGKDFVGRIQTELRGYDLYPHFYNCADYGLAQTRVRFVIVGRSRRVKARFQIPQPTVEKWATVGEVLEGIPEPPIDYSEHTDYPNHYRAKVTPINIERFSHVPQGGGWWDIPEKLQLRCHQKVDRRSGGWPDVYGRLKLDGQAPTITAGFDSFTRGRYGHPLRNRPLTPREAGRLQGFPDDFRFCGTRWDVRSQVGNAVPPPLGEAIGRAICHTLMVEDGLVRPTADDFRSISGVGLQDALDLVLEDGAPSLAVP
ncbi:MAG: DNA cytosine methyltransferase [Bryobacteraceae bacterium]